MGREVVFPYPPKRIISLVPSQTELLVDLGLEDELIGVTKFCVHPEGISKRKSRVGGTKKYDFEKIAALQPDLIIGNKEENERGQIEELAKNYPVWMSDIQNMDDALQMVSALGEICGKQDKAEVIRRKIEQAFAGLDAGLKRRTAYLIWRRPWMAAGRDTFINELLMKIGLENIFLNHEARYPEFSNEELKSLNPELIFLSSEPYPFKEKHIKELGEICPEARIMLVDGEMFSWYGSRLLKAADYLKDLMKQLG